MEKIKGKCTCGNKAAIRGYCNKCYQKLYREGKIQAREHVELPKFIPNKREKRDQPRFEAESVFIQNYGESKNLIYEANTFHFPNHMSYTPDFYDRETDVYYEIVGTTQAYQKNEHKYNLFKVIFPQIKLNFVKPNGEKYVPKLKSRNFSFTV
jgi:hypothetical protein